MTCFLPRRAAGLCALASLLGLLAGCRQTSYRTYFVPAGYEGWVHVVYTDGAAGGPVPHPRPGRATLVVPAGGQLVVRDPMPPDGPIEEEFFAYSPSGQVRALGYAGGGHIHWAGAGYLAVEPTRYGTVAFYVTPQALSYAQIQPYYFPPDTLLHQDKQTPDPAHPFAR